MVSSERQQQIVCHDMVEWMHSVCAQNSSVRAAALVWAAGANAMYLCRSPCLCLCLVQLAGPRLWLLLLLLLPDSPLPSFSSCLCIAAVFTEWCLCSSYLIAACTKQTEDT